MPIEINGKTYTDEQAQAIVDVLGTKNDVTQPTFMQTPHGFDGNFPATGSILSSPGRDPRMISAVPAVLNGMAARLYSGVNRILKAEYDIITGIGAAEGTNPDGFCGTPMTAGLMSVGTTRNSFGEFFLSSGKIVLNKAGGRVDTADIDRTLVNNIAAQSPLLPDILTQPGINSFVGMMIYRFGLTALRQMERVLYTGNVTLTGTNAANGFIKEFDGFDRLIKTGYIDAESLNPMPAADSIVEDFASASALDPASGIVELMANIEYRIRTLADESGLTPVEIELGMRPDLFQALTEVWPSSYLTTSNVVNASAGARFVVTGTESATMRDEMRQGRYLMINGMQIPVRTSTAIPQATAGDGFTSTIYYIPVSVMGERMTYLEGFDQANSEIEQFVGLMAQNDYTTSNNGFWAMTKNQTAMCFELLFAAQPRLIMRTPQLAARIENVQYKLDGYANDPYTDSPYYRAGGRYVDANPYT